MSQMLIFALAQESHCFFPNSNTLRTCQPRSIIRIDLLQPSSGRPLSSGEIFRRLRQIFRGNVSPRKKFSEQRVGGRDREKERERERERERSLGCRPGGTTIETEGRFIYHLANLDKRPR